MMIATSSHTKTRCNSSDGYNTQLDYDYTLERAASSEAELPSYQYHDSSNDGNGSCDDSSSKDSTTPRHKNQLLSPPRKQPYNNRIITPTTTKSKKLQTIESGISLADSAGGQGQTLSPRPPLHPVNSASFGSATSGPLLATIEGGGGGGIGRPDMVARDVSHQSQHSTISYYSVDAGKHGFLTNYGSNVSQDSDNDSQTDANSSNGSLVFKYRPGQETPPAEYALPAAILGVYGEHDVESNTRAASTENAPKLNWNRLSSSEFTNGSQSSIFFTHSEDSSQDPDSPHLDRNRKEILTKDKNTQGAQTQGREDEASSTPKKKKQDASSSSRRVPSNASLVVRPPSHGGPPEHARILPYHERKRLMELEEEEKKRKKSQKMANKLNKTSSGGRVKGRVVFRDDAETTPLAGKQRGTNGYGTSNVKITNYDDAKEQQQQPNKNGWFGQLVSIVTGKQDEDEERDEQRIQDETKDFRDRGQAFLKKTEKERMELKEEKRMDELNNVTVPVTNQSFGGHNRAKMSSMSAALDSIASCDSEEETCSSDEESGTYFYKDEEQGGQLQRPQAAARVWKYGEPPINTTNPNKNATMVKKNSTMSKHDRIMQRERLLQEEYEYRLHSLRKENENLSRKFRIFVLVTVALIFTGALSFAFVVCVRMLMSL